jgi:hypothetical protein
MSVHISTKEDFMICSTLQEKKLQFEMVLTLGGEIGLIPREHLSYE